MKRKFTSIYKIKDNKFEWKKILKLEILHKVKYNKPEKVCILLNMESLDIAHVNTKTLLNSTTELVGKCKYFAKCILET